MALVVEDGTGLATANSFITDAEFTAWASARGRLEGLTQDSGSARAPSIVLAADYLCNEQRFQWRGKRTVPTQALVWPRTGATNRDGYDIASNVVPASVKQAQCSLAWLSMTGVDLQPVLPRGGRIQTKTIGPLSTTYFNDATAETVFAEAMGAIDPLLLGGGKIMALRADATITDEVVVPGFNGEYTP